MIHLKEVRRVPADPAPETVRSELERLGLSQVDGAKLLHVDPRTMRRYLQPVGTPGALRMPFAQFALLKLTKKDNAR